MILLSFEMYELSDRNHDAIYLQIGDKLDKHMKCGIENLPS